MFGTQRSTQQFRPEIRDRGNAAGLNRDGRGIPPVAGAILGTIVERWLAKKVMRRLGPRAGGLPGLVAGAAITYGVNRFLRPRSASRRLF